MSYTNRPRNLDFAVGRVVPDEPWGLLTEQGCFVREVNGSSGGFALVA